MSTISPHAMDTCWWRKTWCTRLLFALLAADRSLAHNHHHHQEKHQEKHQHHDVSEPVLHVRDLSTSAVVRERTCGAPEPTEERRIHDKKLVQTWLDLDLQQRNEKVGGGGYRKLQDTENIVVPVCFHVIRPSSDGYGYGYGDGDITFLDAASLQRQLDALNQAFSPLSCCDEATETWCTGECSIDTGIRFEMLVLDANGDPTEDTVSQVAPSSSSSSTVNVCTTRSFDEAWYTSEQGSAAEERMKRALRRGDARVLNVYFSNPKANAESLLGHATPPSSYVTHRYSDGVVLSDTSIVGGSDTEFNEGVRTVL
jgi:hypothetical protein